MRAGDFLGHRPLGGDVAQRADGAGRQAVGVGEAAGPRFHPAELPVARQIAHRLDGRGGAVLEQRGERVARGLGVIGVHEVHEMAAEALVEREAGRVAPRRVEEGEAAVEILLEEHVGRRARSPAAAGAR